MSAVVQARVVEQLTRLRLCYVADRLDAVLNDAARAEPTYLDYLDGVLRQAVMGPGREHPILPVRPKASSPIACCFSASRSSSSSTSWACRLNGGSAHLFFQLVARRYERGSLLITTNQVVTQWGTLDSLGGVGATKIGKTPLAGYPSHDRSGTAGGLRR